MKRRIGADLHKRQFTVCWMSEKGTKEREYEVSEKGYEKFKKELREEEEIGVEATGNSVYFSDKIKEAEKAIVVINARAKKTDKNDARAKAKYLKLVLLP